MAGKVTIGFEPESVTIPITDILPLRLVDDTARKRHKFRQIAASIREIGIVQPPIVARRSDGKHKYLLLDGHLRIEILKDLGIDEIACLVSLDDEAVTFNRQVNRLSPLQEHKMILKVIERGVPEERIAQALNVNVTTIRAKRDLLNGICPEVAALLKDKHCPINSFQALKKVEPLRQYEIAKTMVVVGDYSVAYARALVSASSPDQLVNPGKARKHRKVSPEEIDQIERELANLQGDVERIEETFAADHLNLVLATSYVRSLLRNAQITKYMETYHGSLLKEFRTICEATAPTAEAAE
ncbi:MAG: ParB N-terminal domain-containing protein [Alphaproteobacteria bacterium]|nr:ParB N-terminal domain-containing protein [Alphaproteobacteria bacterium]